MSVIVWGTFCNPLAQYGLSFYCQGSPSCSVFQSFPAVTCTNQTTRLYCTNGHTCGNANYTNDVYITFPPNGHSATVYDTVTRSGYVFNTSTPITATVSSKGQRDFDHFNGDAFDRRASSPTIVQQVNTQFVNVYGETTNPAHQLTLSLGTQLAKLEPAAGSATVQQAALTHAIASAVQLSTNQTVTYAKGCHEPNGVEAEIAPVNTAAIAAISKAIPQSTFAVWLLSASIGHIIANSALVSEFDIAAKVQSVLCSTSSTISHSTSTKSSTLTPTKTATLTSTTTQSTSAKSTSTSTSTHSVSSTKPTSSATVITSSSSSSKSSGTSSTSTKTQSLSTTLHPTTVSSTISTTSTFSIHTFTPSSCAPAIPSNPAVFSGNSSFSEQLQTPFSLYGNANSTLLGFNESGSLVYSYLADPSTAVVYAQDGSALIYGADGVYTFIAPNCNYAFNITPADLNVSSSAAKGRSVPFDLVQYAYPVLRRSGGVITINIYLTDQCGNIAPGHKVSASGEAIMASYLMVPTEYWDWIYQDSIPFTDNGDGSYTGTLSLDTIQAENANAFKACDGASQDIVGLCGNQPVNLAIASTGFPKVNAAVNYLLTKASPALSSAFTKLTGGLALLSTLCSVITGMNGAGAIVAKLDSLCCTSEAYDLAMTATIDGTAVPLGTVAPTPVSLALATTVSATSTSPATATATPLYSSPLDTGTQHQAVGQADFCCTGSCYDGTRIGDPGLCLSWLDLCGDVSPSPSCGATQVLQGIQSTGLNAGQGACWYFDECEWQLNNWTWTCADCPAGSVAAAGGVCDTSGTSYPAPCVGCEDPTATLVNDPTSGYICQTTATAACGGGDPGFKKRQAMRTAPHGTIWL